MPGIVAVVGSQSFQVESSVGKLDPYAIFNAHFEALGGKDLVKNEKTTYKLGTIDSGDKSFTYEEWNKTPLKSLKTISSFEDVVYKIGDNGSILWAYQNKRLNAYPVADDNDKKLRRKMEEYEYTDPTIKDFKVETKKNVTIDGQRCYEVKISNRLTDEIDYQYYDAKTFMLAREKKIKDGQITINDYSNYKDVNGVKKAFKIETENPATGTKQTLKFTKIERDSYISDDKFKIPTTDPAKAIAASANGVGTNIDTFV